MTLTDNHSEIKKAVHKAARMVIRDGKGKKYTRDEMTGRQEVIAAAHNAIPYLSNTQLGEMIWPPFHLVADVWHGYSTVAIWTLSEACSLAAGMDPVMFDMEPGQNPNEDRERRERIYKKAQAALVHGELTTKQLAGDQNCYVVPREFCVWAVRTGELTSTHASHLVEKGKMLGAHDYLEEYKQCAYRILTPGQTAASPKHKKAALAGFAILTKLSNLALDHRYINKLVKQSVNQEIISASGFAEETIRSDINDIDKDLMDSHAYKESLKKEYTDNKKKSIHDKSINIRKDGFLKIIHSQKEIDDPIAQEQWWAFWHPVILSVYPELELPDTILSNLEIFPEPVSHSDPSKELLQVNKPEDIQAKEELLAQCELDKLYQEWPISDGQTGNRAVTHEEENHGKDTRPDAPCGDQITTISFVILAWQSIVKKILGLRKRKIGRQKIQPPFGVDH